MIKGKIDSVNNWYVKGWAVNTKKLLPLTIEVLVNDELVHKQKASDFRKGLKEKNIHPKGIGGFSVYLGDKINLKNNDIVTVKVDGEIINQPVTYSKVKPSSSSTKNTDKILISGMGKSGTSVLSYTIVNCFDKCAHNFEPNGSNGLGNIDLHRKLVKSDGPVVTKSLYFPGHEIQFKALSNIYEKKIWIIRDPRDKLISNTFYRWYKKHNPKPELFKKVHDLVLKKEKKPSSVSIYSLWENIIRADKLKAKFINENYAVMNIVEKLRSDGWFIYKYEDFMDGKTEELSKYLGKDVQPVESLPGDKKRVQRTATYGDWRKWFTKEDVEYFKPVFNELLAYFNYDINDWKLEEQKTLPKEQGSVYMLNLFEGKK